MVINGSVYNHLSTALVPQQRNTTHKSSDLKAIYNNMAKYNKNSPLYRLDLSDSIQSYIVNLKEAALELKDTSEIFADSDNTLYSTKQFHSSNVSAISGALISQDIGDLPEAFEIKIDNLATEQINIGNYTDEDDLDVVIKKHSFVIETPDGNYDFTIPVNDTDTNLDVQERIVSSINKSNVPIIATLVSDNGKNAVMLKSKETGSVDTDDGLQFIIRSTTTGQDITNVYGLNNVSEMPSNSKFAINGDPHTSSSNHIAINHVIEIDFHSITNEPVSISLIPNTEEVKEQIDKFISSYNKLVDLSKTNQNPKVGTRSLSADILKMSSRHTKKLEMLGIHFDEEGKLYEDENTITSSLEDKEFLSLFEDLASFKSDIGKATDKLSIDPMAYVNKLIVTYPNKDDHFDTPYTQSLYSGLIYNNYA